MRMSAQLVVSNHSAHRMAERDEVDAPSTLRSESGRAVDVHIRNLSASGCFIETAVTLSVGDAARIGLAGAGTVDGRVVRTANDGVAVMFDRPLASDELDQAFTGAQVIQPWDQIGDSTDISDAYERWPRRTRAMIAVGSAVTLWALIFYAVSVV